MIVSFNPTISNKKKQVTNFGQINQPLLTALRTDPGSAINNKVQGAAMFKTVPKTDILDTLKEALTMLSEGFHPAIKRQMAFVEKLNY